MVAGASSAAGRTVEADGDAACVMTMNTDTLDWPMMVLANIDAEFRIEQPAELAELVTRAADRMARSGSLARAKSAAVMPAGCPGGHCTSSMR